MLAGTCQQFPTRRPSEVLGITDDVVAEDFNQAAAWVLRQGDDRRAIDLAKIQAGFTWGGGSSDSAESPNKHINTQHQAHAFFGS